MLTISAEESNKIVKDHQERLSRKAVANLPPQVQKLIDNKELKPLYIFNVSHHRWVDRAGGNAYYVINRCEPGKKFSTPTVIPFIPTYHVPVDMDKVELRTEDCWLVANDVIGVGPFKAKSDDLRRFGVFISENETPTAEELAAANSAYEKSDIALISEADALMLEGPAGLRNITADMRLACERRHVVRDWAKAQKPGKECPGCGEMVPSTAKKHPLCGWRFDLERFEADDKLQQRKAS